MSNEDWNFQVSPKLADGTLVNVRAKDATAFASALVELELIAPNIIRAVAALNGAANVTTHQADPMPAAVAAVQQQIPQAQVVQPQAPPAPAAPAAPAPTCIHGARQFRSSKPGAAKAWSAWMCPTPKGTAGQCEPEWVR